MNKLISITLLYTLFFTLSCNKDVSTQHLIEVNNKSPSKIEIPGFNKARVTLNPNESYDVSYSERGESSQSIGFFPFFNNDSIKLVYNDTLTIYHGSSQYNVTRDIRMVNSYVYDGGGTSHKYTYTFTNADFREADSIIN